MYVEAPYFGVPVLSLVPVWCDVRCGCEREVRWTPASSPPTFCLTNCHFLGSRAQFCSKKGFHHQDCLFQSPLKVCGSSCVPTPGISVCSPRGVCARDSRYCVACWVFEKTASLPPQNPAGAAEAHVAASHVALGRVPGAPPAPQTPCSPGPVRRRR